MDLIERDKQIKDKVYDAYRNVIPMFGVELQNLISDVIDLKNKQFNELVEGRIKDRIEEIAQEKAKDINGIPVRTLVAKDILNTLISRGLKDDVTNNDLASVAVDMTDLLLNKLNK